MSDAQHLPLAPEALQALRQCFERVPADALIDLVERKRAGARGSETRHREQHTRALAAGSHRIIGADTAVES